jgi:DNA-binding PadR family transcriptional regulator
MSRLTPTGRVVLGFLLVRPQTGYDIKQVVDYSTRFFWGASYGQIYPELRRLEAAGLAVSRDEPRGGVRRRVYRITPAGERAVHAWLAEPQEQYEVRDEGLLKLFFGEVLAPGELLELVRRRRAWYEAVRVHFRGIAESLGPIEGPSAEVLRYGIELMDWNERWFARLERRLAGGSKQRSTRGARARAAPQPESQGRRP